jgi:hypothetical protein
MLRRHIACQRDGQAARLIRNKCRGRVTRRPYVRLLPLVYITRGRPRGSIGSLLGQGAVAYADRSAPDWVWTRVDTGPPPRSCSCPGMLCPRTLGPPCGRIPFQGFGSHFRGPNPIPGVQILFQGSGLHKWRSRTNLGGPNYISGVRDQPWGSRLYIQGSGALPWGSGLTVDALEYATFSGHVAASDPPMWQGRALLWTQNSRLRLGRAVV